MGKRGGLTASWRHGGATRICMFNTGLLAMYADPMFGWSQAWGIFFLSFCILCLMNWINETLIALFVYCIGFILDHLRIGRMIRIMSAVTLETCFKAAVISVNSQKPEVLSHLSSHFFTKVNAQIRLLLLLVPDRTLEFHTEVFQRSSGPLPTTAKFTRTRRQPGFGLKILHCSDRYQLESKCPPPRHKPPSQAVCPRSAHRTAAPQTSPTCRSSP